MSAAHPDSDTQRLSSKDSEQGDSLYWLSKVDEDLPRAHFVPDRKRSQAVPRRYVDVHFDLATDVVRVLKSAHPARGLSDAVMCAGLVAMLLGKNLREDQALLGLAYGGGPTHGLIPVTLGCGAGQSYADITQGLASELDAMASHASSTVRHLPQLLGQEVGSHRYPLYDLAVCVAHGQASINFKDYPLDAAFLFNTGGGKISGCLSYAQDLYEPATAQRIVAELIAISQQLGEGTASLADRRVRDMQLLDAAARRQVLVEFNRRSAAYPLHESFHSLFEAQVVRTPQATAVVHGGVRLSYAELNARANRLAQSLLAQGLNKGDFVGILLQRSGEFVVSMLAVFKAGGAYVPMDPTYPRERIAYMLQDSQAGFLITDAALCASFAEAIVGCESLHVLVSLNGPLPGAVMPQRAGLTTLGPLQLDAASPANPQQGIQGSDRAYMIYTSGSTGRPKGAICRHDGALNHLFGELDGIGVGGAFNFLQTAASSSDISVWQFMAPVLRGGATVIADYETVVDPVALLALMREHDVTVAEPVPVVLRALLDHLESLPAEARRLPALRSMMCTGEALPGELVDRWLALHPGVPMANTYGPTETSDDVTLLVLREPIAHRFAVTPIGQPLPNVRIFVLDRELQALPVGVPGELCIAGVAVGEGYWNQPEKTAAAFVACPFPEVATGQMYRTGDLCRWLPDGVIEFLGRIDQQVKLRGFRVEPGEIEEVLNRHPDVQDAAVVVVEDGAGTRRLVGFYVPHKTAPAGPVGATELRQYLRAELAEHMVPSSLMPLRALPLTPLGKVDRRALGRMQAPAEASANYVAPVNDVQSRLAAVWQSVTGTARVGLHDNFFEIGGDSILTIHVVAALRGQGFELAPRDLFKHPTVAELAAHLGARREPANAVAAPVAAAPAPAWDVARWRDALTPLLPELVDVYPLSATQRGIYYQSLLVPKNSGAYVEQVGLELHGALDTQAFAAAWQHVIQQVDSLRTAVVRRGAPHPLQAVVKRATLEPSLLDLRELAPQRQDQRIAVLATEDRAKAFDLKRPPLMRVTLMRRGQTSWHMLWTYHHLILDGWAEPLVLGDVLRSYAALQAGQAPPPIVCQPYRDFVVWSEAQAGHDSEAFWRAQLAGYSNPVSIHDASPGVTPPSMHEISHGWSTGVQDAGARQLLLGGIRRHGLTLSTVLHGAWALLLCRESGARDVVLGSVASGRQGAMSGIETVRGLVAATLPLRTQVAADTEAAAWLRLMQLQMAEIREHEHTPLGQIQQWSDVPLDKRPMFDTLVVVGNYAGHDLSACAVPGLTPGSAVYQTQPLFAFTLFATLEPELKLTLVYDRKRCAPDTAVRLLADYQELVMALAQGPEQRLGNLLLPSPSAAV